ncbi:MAG: hypothetical protein SNH94_02625 [Rikenellaceae bacterium]
MRRFAQLILGVAALFATTTAHSQEITDPYTTHLLEKMTGYYDRGIDEKLYLQLDKPYYSAGEQIWFKGYLLNAITHGPLKFSNFIYVELIKGEKELVSRVKVKRDSTGFNGYMALDAQLTEGDYTLRGYTRWMLNKEEDFLFSRALKIISPIPATALAPAEQPTKSDKKKQEEQNLTPQAATPLNYDLQFFPEGGALLAGVSQIVAFKAIGEDGLSVEVSGAVYNAQGEFLSEFRSTHKGMGILSIFANQGDKYYAMVKTEEGLERRFDLPAVEAQGAIITARKVKDRLMYKVASTDEQLTKGSHVVVSSHGRVVSIGSVDLSDSASVPMSQLFEGVNILSLVDAAGSVISERLVFKFSDTTPTLSVTTDKENYASRQKAKVSVKILDSFGEGAKGEFGVSVTDNSAVEFNSADGNIVSYLLLTSDLKGHIEAPGLYFSGDAVSDEYNIDLLMRTQGWRRFDLGGILAEQLPATKYNYEDVAQISGEVKGFFGNAARQPKIYVLSAQRNYMDVFDLDLSNKFVLRGLDIPDSTIYVIQARGRKGGNSLTLNINPEVFPAVQPAIYPRKKSLEAYVPIAFVNQSQDKFYYDGGMSLIDMDAVYVTLEKGDVESSTSSSFSTRSSSREELELMSGFTLPNIIRTFPSMTVSDEGVSYRGNSKYAKFVVDDMEMDFLDISYLSASEIETIDFLDSTEASMYSDAAGGVFVVKLRDGASATAGSPTPPGIATVEQLGYQRPMSFYQPRYNVPALKENLPPDYRTTIFWDGSLEPDAEGNISFEFYTADKATNYTVTIEGVTTDGEICHSATTISRNAIR